MSNAPSFTIFVLTYAELLSEYQTPSRIEAGIEILLRLWEEQHGIQHHDAAYDVERLARRVWTGRQNFSRARSSSGYTGTRAEFFLEHA